MDFRRKYAMFLAPMFWHETKIFGTNVPLAKNAWHKGSLAQNVLFWHKIFCHVDLDTDVSVITK